MCEYRAYLLAQFSNLLYFGNGPGHLHSHEGVAVSQPLAAPALPPLGGGGGKNNTKLS